MICLKLDLSLAKKQIWSDNAGLLRHFQESFAAGSVGRTVTPGRALERLRPVNRLRQFWHAAAKIFDVPRRLRALRDHRTDPQISAPVSHVLLPPCGPAPFAFQQERSHLRPGDPAHPDAIDALGNRNPVRPRNELATIDHLRDLVANSKGVTR